MGMYFDKRGIDHQPFKVWPIDQLLQQTFPNPLVPPANITAVRIAPIAVIRWQIPPRRTRPQNPKYRVDELPVVLRHTAPNAFTPR
jgi:hypothetical protein